ncbi:DUF885 domain-containing protein [Jiangella ureilytica]|uniref:DUF885 domain-containing protein n=1 Tax=Jiangella ureilytica TaxID=2530374 RepID=A0A4R4RUC6_9ACTN|nr:DUF885 domain-containing protein [Jiangella ureilytica]TDC53264.1 DUF885 domain-containing protein [Jiangella ureilytica]
MAALDDPLTALADEYFDLQMRADPLTATAFGVAGYDGEVPDPSREADQRRMDQLAALAERLAGIDPAGLDEQERVTHAMLGRLLRDGRAVLAAGLGADAFEVAVTGSIAGAQSLVLSTVPAVRLADGVAVDAYLHRLGGLAGYFDTLVERYLEAAASGRVPTALGVRQAVGQVDAYLELSLDDDPLARPAGVAGGEVADRAREMVARMVRPALVRFRDALADELLAVGRGDARVGLRHVPGGEDAYLALVRAHTTTDLTPAVIHEIGMERLAAVHTELAELGARAFGSADVAAVLGRLRDDPSLRFRAAEEILSCVRSALDRAMAEAPRWFRPYDLAPCDVEEMHPVEAEGATLAYYRPPAADGSRPGAHVVNTLLPGTRPRHEYEALAFHESVPGHHLQLALGQTLTGIPDFRRFGYVAAHSEGWGLYTERLADEMGLYTSDLMRMGMLSFEAWRACRLVVDTGMHHLGWSRSRAVAFLRDNSATSPSNVVNEIDRYIAWPGQALAYLIGRLRIGELRAESERRLGERFDVRDFHHEVLASGSVPLDVLDGIIDRWIASVAETSAV